MLVGRELQREFKEEPQCILTMPLLEGTDGLQKMSKSLDNYIGITEPASEIFGKTMSISDDLMLRYYELLTDADLKEVKQMHPKEAKKKLASILVSKFHGETAAKEAEQEFESIFAKGNIPQEIKEIKLPKSVWRAVDILSATGMAASGSEARRIIKQGGFSVEGKTLLEENAEINIDEPKVLRKGKRNFLRVVKG
jgi:tyrosyl-tRNA synthetase